MPNTKVRGDMAAEAMFAGGTLLAIGRCACTGSAWHVLPVSDWLGNGHKLERFSHRSKLFTEVVNGGSIGYQVHRRDSVGIGKYLTVDVAGWVCDRPVVLAPFYRLIVFDLLIYNRSATAHCAFIAEANFNHFHQCGGDGKVVLWILEFID